MHIKEYQMVKFLVPLLFDEEPMDSEYYYLEEKAVFVNWWNFIKIRRQVKNNVTTVETLLRRKQTSVRLLPLFLQIYGLLLLLELNWNINPQLFLPFSPLLPTHFWAVICAEKRFTSENHIVSKNEATPNFYQFSLSLIILSITKKMI